MSLFGGIQPQTNPSMFGNTAPKPSLFGAPATAAQPSTNTSTLFGGQNQQPATTSAGATGAFGASAAPQQPSGSMFGNPQKPQNTFGSGALGQPQQQQQQQGSAFGSSLQKPQASLFSGGQQQTQQAGGGLGGLGGLGSNTQQPTNALGQQQSQFGQNTMTTPQPQQQQPSLSSSLWSPGRAITGGEPNCIIFYDETLLTRLLHSAPNCSYASCHNQG